MKNYTEDFQGFSLNEMAKAMKNMDDKVLNDLIGIIEDAGFETINHWGRIHIQPSDDIKDVAVLGYDFQKDDMRFTLTVLGRKIPSQPGRSDYFDFWMSFNEEGYKQYKEFRQILKRELTAAKRVMRGHDLFGED